METTSYTYTCPNAATCRLHKRCHVLTTAEELTTLVPVWQLCPAEGRNPDGSKAEILVHIGKTA